ncbi:Retrovirus-related Pol polyprotein from transposon RE2 [Vitis vinifera]|uniref:Retrovirus-related Pol polyprotein from transposon RE2 n=1 Tax=Vitis vinifera TaxID=29760 RepID=A0A438CEA1_VITVI|nr:Retrovirus-related Pol polyprotein from transposon RE2 [Vitis vinifera]
MYNSMFYEKIPKDRTKTFCTIVVFHSGHLPISQYFPVSRTSLENHSPPAKFSRRTFRRTFPETYFPTPTIQKERLEEISNFCEGTGTKRGSTRRPRAIFRPATASPRRRVRAREAFSGDAPPPPASSAADQHPYLPGSPIRALHVPLLGIFVSVSPPNSLSGEVPATFSPPQSLHVPWEVFFYLSVVPRRNLKPEIGCRWVYAVKVGPDGQIASVRLLLSMAAMCSWPLYQLDIKNAFLHGDLAEEVYMEQPPGFVAQGESGLVCRLRRSLYGLKQSPRAWFSRFSSVVQEFGMLRSTADHSVFYHHNSLGQCIYLVVYVDDIVITGSDQDGIQKLKQHLFTHFQTKDLGKLKYFLGIEIAQSSSGVVLSQRKYALDILEETGEPLGDPGRYRRLVGKLNYLTITRPDISFPVSVVSQFLQSPCDSHWDAVIHADWAGSPTDRRSTSGYCVFIGGNLISWKSKKQDVVARSSAEAEYRAMALATCELIWLRHLLQELRFGKDEQMKLICDNQAALHIASNPVFHERTKHIEVDCHFIREKIASGCIATSFVNSNDQLADIFTKSLRGPRIKYICNKLGAYDVYAPA